MEQCISAFCICTYTFASASKQLQHTHHFLANEQKSMSIRNKKKQMKTEKTSPFFDFCPFVLSSFLF